MSWKRCGNIAGINSFLGVFLDQVCRPLCHSFAYVFLFLVSSYSVKEPVSRGLTWHLKTRIHIYLNLAFSNSALFSMLICISASGPSSSPCNYFSMFFVSTLSSYYVTYVPIFSPKLFCLLCMSSCILHQDVGRIFFILECVVSLYCFTFFRYLLSLSSFNGIYLYILHCLTCLFFFFVCFPSHKSLWIFTSLALSHFLVKIS